VTPANEPPKRSTFRHTLSNAQLLLALDALERANPSGATVLELQAQLGNIGKASLLPALTDLLEDGRITVQKAKGGMRYKKTPTPDLVDVGQEVMVQVRLSLGLPLDAVNTGKWHPPCQGSVSVASLSLHTGLSQVEAHHALNTLYAGGEVSLRVIGQLKLYRKVELERSAQDLTSTA